MKKRLFFNFVLTLILGCETKMILDESINWFISFLGLKMMPTIFFVQRISRLWS